MSESVFFLKTSFFRCIEPPKQTTQNSKSFQMSLFFGFHPRIQTFLMQIP